MPKRTLRITALVPLLDPFEPDVCASVRLRAHVAVVFPSRFVPGRAPYLRHALLPCSWNLVLNVDSGLCSGAVRPSVFSNERMAVSLELMLGSLRAYIVVCSALARPTRGDACRMHAVYTCFSCFLSSYFARVTSYCARFNDLLAGALSYSLSSQKLCLQCDVAHTCRPLVSAHPLRHARPIARLERRSFLIGS